MQNYKPLIGELRVELLNHRSGILLDGNTVMLNHSDRWFFDRGDGYG